MTLSEHLAYLEAEYAAAVAAPLSRRRLQLVVALADAYADRLFAASGEDDVLVFRAALAARSQALALVMDLAALRPDGPALAIEAVEVPIARYGELGVEDFMVSLYNANTIRRVRIVLPDGGRLPAPEIVGEALAFLRDASAGS